MPASPKISTSTMPIEPTGWRTRKAQETAKMPRGASPPSSASAALPVGVGSRTVMGQALWDSDVTPAKAGVQGNRSNWRPLDSRFRGNDEEVIGTASFIRVRPSGEADSRVEPSVEQ